MEMAEMQQITGALNGLSDTGNNISTGNIRGLTTTAGTAIGGLVGGPVGAMVGGSIGNLIGGFTESCIPKYQTIKGSSSSINFVGINRKPYWLEYHCPTKEELIKLDKIYKYYGCATHRTEPLSISSYMYQGHAYVKGDLHYNETIPLKYFQQINNIFNRGVHILEK